jgi:hypothetical protein
MQITESTAEELGELLDGDVRTDYSGRGMMGTECFGIVTSQTGWDLSRTIMDIVGEEGNSEVDDAVVYLSEHEPRTDSLGMDTIYYWPGLTVIED